LLFFKKKYVFLYPPNRYGDIFGLWLGPDQAVVVNTYGKKNPINKNECLKNWGCFSELIQEVGQREETITRLLPPFLASLKQSLNPSDPCSTPGNFNDERI